MNMNIELYKTAIELTMAIKQIESTIKGLDSNIINGRITLRSDESIGCSCRASVRHTAYIQFLHGEVKDHQKDLKAIEAEINAQFNSTTQEE